MRNASHFVALSFLILGCSWQPVSAASFDCSKAEAADEKAICADHQLNDADVEMSVLYVQLKPFLGMGARGDMEDQQVAWLKRRAACGADHACLSKAYADRLQQLKGGFEALAKRGPF